MPGLKNKFMARFATEFLKGLMHKILNKNKKAAYS